MNEKPCILYEDRVCTDCGECDQCELDPRKKCDNCMRCVTGSAEYRAVVIDRVQGAPEQKNKKK